MSSASRPSIQDVARLAGVAVGTVSNVLNAPEKVRPETLEKVSKAITQLGFIRNDAARQLKAGKSQTIGMIVLDSSNPFFAKLAQGAEDYAMEHGYSLILGNSGNDDSRESKYINLFEEQRMAGVLVTPAGGTNTGLASHLANKGFKAVVVDRMADADICCSVGVDDIAGGRTAVGHLLDLGRRRVAFVGGPLGIKQVQDRLAGAREAVARVQGAELRLMESNAMTVLAGREVGERILALPASDRPDAVFASNDLLAVGLLQALVFNSQVRVPEEIAIVGYDDIDFAQAAIVPLSSIRQPAAAIGASAVQLLVDEVENPSNHTHRQVVFQPELVVRESSGI